MARPLPPPRLPRKPRGKKKSDSELNEQLSAAVAELSTPPVAAAPPTNASALPADQEPEREESIYEIMKQEMLRKKEEQEAKNAQWKQQQRPNGRPSYGRPAAAPPPPPPSIEKVSNPSDLPAVWSAARNYLAANARILENVLGNCTRIESLNPDSREVTLAIPTTHRNFTNDRAQARLEEALRAVTGLPLKLQVEFIDTPLPAPPPGSSAIGVTPLAAAQRIPPELMEAVQKQPLIQQLMTRLDATVTQVEVLAPTTQEASDT